MVSNVKVKIRFKGIKKNSITLRHCTGKMKGGIGWNLRISGVERYIYFSRQKHQIDVLYVSFNAWDSQVSFYTPFHFSFTVPFMYLYRIVVHHSWNPVFETGFQKYTLSYYFWLWDNTIYFLNNVIFFSLQYQRSINAGRELWGRGGGSWERPEGEYWEGEGSKGGG